MTRSIGDIVAKSVGVICEPEIMEFPNISQNAKIVVLASDGLWDKIPNEEVIKIV